MLVPSYRHVVAGGGAAGVAVVGALLHYAPKDKIAWVDPDFSGGRLSKQYRDVSSNTKVKLFLDYAQALRPFEEVIASTPKPNAVTALQNLDQNKGCRLSFAADTIQMLTAGLRRHENVDTYLGRISSAEHDGQSWHINASTNGSSAKQAEAQRMVLCTGSSPSALSLPTSKPITLDLDNALDRTQLRRIFPPSSQATIGIVGTSHSAVVVIMNLWELITTTHPHLHIRWFIRTREMRYAVEMDGWILRDNTGLKGASADFAREHLEPEKLEHSPLGKVLTPVHCPDASSPEMAPELDKCTHVVQAIGYTRDQLPDMKVNGRQVGDVKWDPEVGRLLDGKHATKLPEAYGAGIAFPRRTTDPLGNQEYAVGMWKFMTHLQEVVPIWLQDGR